MSSSYHTNVKNKNREEILIAGKTLFLKHNFFSVNIKDVCTLAGVSRVTFYKYFKTIDELIFQVQIDILINMTRFIKEKDQCDMSGKERLKSMLYAWIKFAKEHRDQMKFIILFDLYYEDYDSNKELKASYEKFILEDYNENFLNAALETGIKDGSLKGDLNLIKTGFYIFQTVMGLLQRMSYTKFPGDDNITTFDDISETIVEVIISNIENSSSLVML